MKIMIVIRRNCIGRNQRAICGGHSGAIIAFTVVDLIAEF